MHTLALLAAHLALAQPTTPPPAPLDTTAAITAALDDPARTLTKDELAAAALVARSASDAAPTAAALVTLRADLARVAASRDEARDLYARAVALDPANALLRERLGTAIFSSMSGGASLAMLGKAEAAMTEYKRAVELDPARIEARIGMANFYVMAPAIAGGSYKKARQQAADLLALNTPAATNAGRLVEALIAQHREDWAEMTAAYEAALAAPPDPDNPAASATTLRAYALALLRVKEDPKAALPVTLRLRAAAPPADPIPDALHAEALAGLGRHAEAAPIFESVLARLPEARLSRYGAAASHAALGDKTQAIAHYEEFLRRFPTDNKADGAKSALKKLRKK